MSFEDEVGDLHPVNSSYNRCIFPYTQDLLSALGHLKHGSAIAYQHRKRAASLPTRLVGLVVGSLNTSGVGWIKSMTPVERHAELVYAESLYERVSSSRTNVIH